jgi:GNAT superfamily N-acetyltransferase
LPDENIELDLRELQPGDILTGLSLGETQYNPLKTFLRRDAKNYHANDLGKTYGLFETIHPRIWGYITLVCGEIVAEENAQLVEADVNYRYRSFPAVKIARLAVDRRMRGSDLGSKLVQFSLGIIKVQICPRVGCRFAVVDAKRDSVGFYRKQGFTLLETEANRRRDEPIMFIDLTKIPVG